MSVRCLLQFLHLCAGRRSWEPPCCLYFQLSCLALCPSASPDASPRGTARCGLYHPVATLRYDTCSLCVLPSLSALSSASSQGPRFSPVPSPDVWRDSPEFDPSQDGVPCLGGPPESAAQDSHCPYDLSKAYAVGN